jgi:hypothetical protein
MWETEAEVKATEASGYLAEQIAELGRLLVAPLARETFEVRVLFV